ncbi:MAG: S-layer homology domain-containing protein [Oscillospiraceae bacterium]|nr:S-layer homology domain-containing protein [Oscillospiraceae bacterium]
MKRFSTALCSLLLILCLCAAVSAAYTDVPSDSWAAESIEKATQHELMQGTGDGLFGYGSSISRAEFVTVLVRMFGWELPSTEDTHWAAPYIAAAAQNGAVSADEPFRPDDAITRSEMSVMLVSALGLSALAEEESDAALPFLDVSANRGYIAIAYEIGMTKGMSETQFAPDGTATREQAATMLVRIYEKYHQPSTWKHAFYAISSSSQLELAKQFDEVSLGWSRMTYSEETGAKLEKTTKNNNEYYIPTAYADVVKELESAAVALKLGVFMSDNSLRKMLADETARTQAVAELVNELTRIYPALERNPYSGITVDFEGLRKSDRENFILFMTQLREALPAEMTLYAAVMPATPDGIYYDGYDFAALGTLCDRVILMAHDYANANLSGFLGSKYHQTQALTPLHKVYFAVRDAARTMGTEKLSLQLSIDAMAWKTDENGRLSATTPTRTVHSTIYQRLTEGAVRGWSSNYRNAYATYQTEAGEHIFLWYENERSIEEKVGLARLLGVTGVSVWRLGLIPNYADEGLSYDAMRAIS